MQKIIYILIIYVVISGCSAPKRSQKTDRGIFPSYSLTTDQITGKNLTKDNFIIQRAEIEIISEGRQTDLLASLKYQKEGKYLISIRTKSGIEVVRIYITRDTILANDRVNKKLYYGSPAYLENKYGISIITIPIVLGDLILEPIEYSLKIECKNNISEINGTFGQKVFSYTIDCGEQKLKKVSFYGEAKENQIELLFNNYMILEHVKYPGTIEIKDLGGETSIKVSIKRIEILNEEELRFIPGKGYEQVRLK